METSQWNYVYKEAYQQAIAEIMSVSPVKIDRQIHGFFCTVQYLNGLSLIVFFLFFNFLILSSVL